jgi:hypothetical protein
MRNVITIIRQYWLLMLAAVLLFTYIFLRAYRLSLTWDEAFTFFEYVRTPRWWPGGYNYMSANNHLLNTWLMKCSVFFFGESEVALRLPNILAGGIFLFAAAQISICLTEKHWQTFIVFLLFAANPYLLDFFSLARGYGISIAMLTMAIAQLTRYVFGKNELRFAVYAQLFLAAALFANLTTIYFFLTVSFLLLLNRVVFHRGEKFKSSFVILTIIPVLALLILLPYLHHLRSAAALFYGEEVNSPAGTFLSLSKAMAYHVFYSEKIIPLMTIVFSAIPLIAVIYVLRNILSITQNEKGKWLVFVTLTLFFVIAGPVLLHFIFHANYLSGRTALFYIPLLVLNLTAVLVMFPPKLKNTLLVISGLFVIVHFGFACNFYFTFDWKEQADVKKMMVLLKEKNIQPAENCFSDNFATELPYEKQVNYYRMRLGMTNFSHAERNEFSPACSYYYLGTSSYMSETAFTHRQTNMLRDFPLSQTWLFNFPEEKKLSLVKESWQDFEHEDPYRELKTDTVYIGEKGTFADRDFPYSINVPLEIPDTVHGSLVVSLNCRLYYYTRNTSALLVMSCEGGRQNSWTAMHITELPDKPMTWSMTNWTRPLPEGTKKIRVYLWNNDKTPVLMDNVCIRLLKENR